MVTFRPNYLKQSLDCGNSHDTRPISFEEFRHLETFVTFGSPLNKVLYFFRRKLNINETVRTHIIKELYWYRGPQTGIVPGVKDDPNFDISTGKRALSHSIYWLNVYSLLDPISAKLIFYENTYEYGLWFNQHMGYWHEPKFYKEVLLALQGKNKKAKPPK